MMMNDRLFVGRYFLELRNYPQAEKWLRKELSRCPEDAHVYALLAWAIASQGRTPEALRFAKKAIHLDPQDADNFYTLGFVQSGFDLVQAINTLETAIRMDSENPAYYGLLGRLYLQCDREKLALETALRGRALDPSDIACASVQVIALMRLGRVNEARLCAHETLTLDPSSAPAHAAFGWTMLAHGQPEMARYSFAQALRINPMLHNARAGMVEALKTRWPVYALLLRLFFSYQRLPKNARELLLLFFLLAAIALATAVMTAYPANAALWVFFPVLVMAVLAVWRQMFDLLLYFDPYTRIVLRSSKETTANWLAAALLGVVVALMVGVITESLPYAVLAWTGGVGFWWLFLGAIHKDGMRPF